MSSDKSKPGLFVRIVRILLSRRAVWIYWIVNLSLLAGLVIWIFLDGSFSRTANLVSQLDSWENTFLRPAGFHHSLSTRVQILQGIMIACMLSASGIFAALFAGSKKSRNLRSWLAVMFALAAWLTLFSAWPDYAGYAKAWRLRPNLPAMEKLAKTLLDNWPSEDGQLPEIGPFTAYPIGKPRHLMLLKKPTVPGTNIRISEIYRFEDSELQFTLADYEDRTVLVYLPLGEQPSIFFNGMSGKGDLGPGRFQSLGTNWFLVQY